MFWLVLLSVDFAFQLISLRCCLVETLCDDFLALNFCIRFPELITTLIAAEFAKELHGHLHLRTFRPHLFTFEELVHVSITPKFERINPESAVACPCGLSPAPVLPSNLYFYLFETYVLLLNALFWQEMFLGLQDQPTCFPDEFEVVEAT